VSTSIKDQIKQAFTYAKDYICRRIDVVDNLSSTSSDLPLSAKQGKELLSMIDKLKSDFLDLTYPIGSIYISTNNTNPSELFGGTWIAWGGGRVIAGVDSNQTEFNTVEKTGGAKYTVFTPSGTVQGHTLTINEMPSHGHYVPQQYLHRLDSDDNNFVNYGQNGTLGGWCIQWPTSVNTGVTRTGIPAFNTNNNGGGASHSHEFIGNSISIDHFQPYVTCYMFKRTA
jgi:hypothetical protein